MALNQHKRAAGIFPSIEDATPALTELQAAGFPMEKVSVIARAPQGEDEIAGAQVRADWGNQADVGAEAGAEAGGTLGTVTGLLVGLGLLSFRASGQSCWEALRQPLWLRPWPAVPLAPPPVAWLAVWLVWESPKSEPEFIPRECRAVNMSSWLRAQKKR